MSKIIIFEPALCCPTGVCGPSVDTELLRITNAITKANMKAIQIERYNLKDHPMKFVEFPEVNVLIQKEGIAVLPLSLKDGEVLTKGHYPSDEMIEGVLGISLKTVPSSFSMV